MSTSTQLTLLDATATPQQVGPRCRMCARSARWMPGRQQYGMYCAGTSCDNRERICQSCTSLFAVNANGAGTKYCSTDCKAAGYHPTSRARSVCCTWCGAQGSSGYANPGRVWPYICSGCLDPIKHVVDRLKAHRVPHERARQLLTNPACEICGADLLAKFREGGHGRLKAALVVDHDHECCPVDSHSCGQCIRGLICRQCNAAAGLLKDSADNAQALARYLKSWPSRAAA